MNVASMRQLGTALLVALVAPFVSAGTLSFTCSTDKPAVSYKAGEPMVFTIQLLDDGKPAAGQKLSWTRRGDDQKREQGEATSSDTQPLVITTTCERPGFVHLEVFVIGEDGKRLKDAKNQDVAGSFGAGAEPEKLQGVPEPDDFDAFWARQKAKLSEVPMNAKLTPVESGNAKFDVFDVKIDCPGGKPVSGYLSLPKGAGEKSLQARVGFMGYGIASAGKDYRDNTISFNINAHGIENGREREYYQQLGAGELKGYAFNKEQNSDAETAYFNGMMLRVLRALEYVKSRPEWNGKDLFADGGSQGALQSITAAGLDPDVNRCFAWKPWCCDLGGGTLGRIEGWRPAWTPALAYYDPIHHAKRIRCDTSIISGLGDYVCPPSTNAVLYNNLAGPKTIEYIQGSTHGFDPKNAERFRVTNK